MPMREARTLSCKYLYNSIWLVKLNDGTTHGAASLEVQTYIYHAQLHTAISEQLLVYSVPNQLGFSLSECRHPP
jgi:hypothetical protein